MGLVLGIQTATAGPVNGVALAGEGPVRARPLHEAATSGTVERLIPAIDLLLRDSGVDWEELAGIAVASGPGSFSGIRVGCATAQALAFARGLPLVGVPTFDAVAHALPPDDVAVLVLLPARTTAWYLLFVQRSADGWTSAAAPEAVSVPEAVGRVDGPVRLAAPAESLAMWGELLGERVVAQLPDGCYPRAEAVAELGRQRLLAGQAVEPADLRPVYVSLPRITIPRPRPVPRLERTPSGGQ